LKTLKTMTLLAFLGSFLVACASDFNSDSSDDSVWIDVRTTEEYSADHVDGDANIPLATIDPLLLASQFGKDAEINLYCRSGNRAGQAKALLEAAGFTNVKNVGGIDDARKLRDLARSSNAQ